MRSDLRLPSWLCALVLMFALWAVPAAAQMNNDDIIPPPVDEEAEAAEEAVEEIEEPVGPTTRRHEYRFTLGATGHYLAPVNILKEEIHDINDLTKAGTAVGAKLKFFLLDELAITFAAQRGGCNFVDDQSEDMRAVNGLLDNLEDGGDALTPDSYLKLDMFSVGITTYFTNSGPEKGRISPYVSARGVYVDWGLYTDGRDGLLLSYQGTAIEGTDIGLGIGFGAEYRLKEKAVLDLGFSWTYLLTGDDIVYGGFQAPNDSYYWTNTHVLDLTLGLEVGF